MTSHSPSGRKNIILHYRPYILAFTTAILTFAVFLPALQNGFVNWDDDNYILNNSNIHSLNGTTVRWAFTAAHWANWHPLTWLSHAADYALWGMNPLGHHMVNILLHAANTFLVVIVCLLLVSFGNQRPGGKQEVTFLDRNGALIAACATGLLFGLHPLHVESVAWVSERKDLLCGFFFLLSVLMYVNHVRVWDTSAPSGRNLRSPFRSWRYFLSLLFFLLALLSKPMAVSLPLVLLILDWHPLRRITSRQCLLRPAGEKVPFFALSLLLSGITVLSQRAVIELNEQLPLYVRLLVAAKASVIYLIKMAVPAGLLPYYGYPAPQEVGLDEPHYLFSVIFLIVVTAALFHLARKRKAPGAFAAWASYVVILLPASGIVQVGTQSMADRYTYLPSIGPFLVAGCIAAWLWERASSRQAARWTLAAAAVAVTVVMSGLTHKQISVWRNSITLWTSVIHADPGCDSIAYFNRGAAFGAAGQLERAAADLSIVIRRNPFSHLALMNRATVNAGLGRFDQAIEDYTRVIALMPDFLPAYVRRGDLYVRLGNTGRAAADYRRACDSGSDEGCRGARMLESAQKRAD